MYFGWNCCFLFMMGEKNMGKKQLFCIPYAGGNASFFNNLKKYLEDSVEVYNLEYSGHGARRREPFYRDFKELLAEVKEQIKNL